MRECPVCGFDEEGGVPASTVSRAVVLVATDALAQLATQTRMMIDRADAEPRRLVELSRLSMQAERAARALAELAFLECQEARPLVSDADAPVRAADRGSP